MLCTKNMRNLPFLWLFTSSSFCIPISMGTWKQQHTLGDWLMAWFMFILYIYRIEVSKKIIAMEWCLYYAYEQYPILKKALSLCKTMGEQWKQWLYAVLFGGCFCVMKQRVYHVSKCHEEEHSTSHGKDPHLLFLYSSQVQAHIQARKRRSSRQQVHAKGHPYWHACIQHHSKVTYNTQPSLRPILIALLIIDKYAQFVLDK